MMGLVYIKVHGCLKMMHFQLEFRGFPEIITRRWMSLNNFSRWQNKKKVSVIRWDFFAGDLSSMCENSNINRSTIYLRLRSEEEGKRRTERKRIRYEKFMTVKFFLYGRFMHEV